LPPDDVAAIFLEPVQGEGGYVVPPQKFFAELRPLANDYGILLIFDEVQSGMGRTGKMFACEHFGAVPDVITLAKGIASGLPRGATVARAELMQWPPGAHASTFGGHPVAVAAVLVTVERIPIVGDVRGLVQMCFERGLLLLGAGPNSIRLCPPLVIIKDQADFAADTIEGCLKIISASQAPGRPGGSAENLTCPEK
jgi:4-aminobutyrate aminotransferase